MAQIRTTVGSIAQSLTWEDKTTESATGSLNNLITDAGQVLSSTTFTTGSGEQQTDELFHHIDVLVTGDGILFDLTAVTGAYMGTNITRIFDKVKTLIIRNAETEVGADIGVAFTGDSAWNEPLAYPTGTITIHPKSALIISRPLDGWEVNAANREFYLSDIGGSGATYHIAVIGNA